MCVYDKNKFEETSKFIKLCYEYPDLSYGFYWLLRARSGYRLDARIAIAAKIVDQMCWIEERNKLSFGVTNTCVDFNFSVELTISIW